MYTSVISVTRAFTQTRQQLVKSRVCRPENGNMLTILRVSRQSPRVNFERNRKFYAHPLSAGNLFMPFRRNPLEDQKRVTYMRRVQRRKSTLWRNGGDKVFVGVRAPATTTIRIVTPLFETL